ncbi:MAG: beta-ketoacyl synthase N-terminal-like domain-containing protein [Phycisphaerae bacterium]
MGSTSVPTLGGALEELVRGTGMRGEYVVSTACTSGLVAMIEGAMRVARGEREKVVAVGVDVAGAFVRDGFAALKAVSATGCRPFDRERNGLMLGSGAAGCVIGADLEGAVAVISGFGVSNDAVHMTAPDREAGGLVRAIRAALEMAGLAPGDVDVVFAHGTGTMFNDAMEGVAIERVFLECGASPAVTGCKGVIGHTLGAAGLMEGVLGVEMIRRGEILPVVGLRVAERGGIDFVREVRRGEVRHVLKIGSGFGGMNAAVVLSGAGAVRARAKEAPEPRAAPPHRGGGRRRVGVVAAGAGEDAMGVMGRLMEFVPEGLRERVGLVIGTTLGCLETDREFERSRVEAGGRYASPAAFSRTLPSTVAAELGLKFGVKGPSLVVSAGDSSAGVAIRRAVEWMEMFGLAFCVAGGVEWVGEGLGVEVGRRVGLVLLGREENAMGFVEVLREEGGALGAVRDRSLEELMRVIEGRGGADVGGVRVVLE